MKIKMLLAATMMMAAAFVSCSVEDNAGENSGVYTPIEATEVTNITPEFIASVSGLEAGVELKRGGTFTLTLTPGEILWDGFHDYHMEHIHVHVGDKVYMPEFPKEAGESVQEITMEIPVPDKPFPVVIAYAVQQQLSDNGYTLYLEDNGDGIELFGVSHEKKYKYFDCYLRTPEAYNIDKIEFKMGDSEWEEIPQDDWGWNGSYGRYALVDNIYQVNIRPGFQDVTGDVTLRVSGTQHKRSKITWKNTEFINMDVPEGYQPNVLPESAIGGNKVYAQIYTKDDYYLAGATSNVEGVNPECLQRAYVVFTMPEQDVEITLDFKEKIPVTYQASAHISKAEIFNDRDIYYGVPTAKAIPGESVFLFANAEQGYKPAKAINDKGEQSDFVIYGEGLDVYGYYAEVHVPENATSMTVSAEAVTAYIASGNNVSFAGGQYYAAGETVNFTIVVPANKKIDTVSATDANGNDVAITLDATYGSFTMPAADVTVNVTFKDIDPSEEVTITAYYDEDEYGVYSQSQAYYGSIGSEGIIVPTGTSLYINVQDYYGEPFWVGVKIGDNVQYFQAEEDPDSGEYTFGRSFTFTDNSAIKVGASKNAVTF